VCLDGGNSAALSFWLTQFQANGEDDEIRLRAGTFVAPPGGFVFQSLESRSLVVTGRWNAGCTSTRDVADTILDGHGSDPLMRLTNVNGDVVVRRIIFLDGFKSAAPRRGFISPVFSAGGLQVNGSVGQGANVLIELNQFLLNEDACDCASTGSAALLASTASGVLRVRNNLFVGNIGKYNAAARILARGTSTAYVTSNTVVGNGKPNAPFGGMTLNADPGVAIVASNNIFWINLGFDLNVGSATTLISNNIEDLFGTPNADSTGNLSVDPDFDGGSFLSFKLKPASPMVNAGTEAAPGGLTNQDLAGNTRIQGFSVDIGAYETDVLFTDAFE
jgi:hypothetical protein